eukprot:3238079-Karenia_brevis.AAC.1
MAGTEPLPREHCLTVSVWDCPFKGLTNSTSPCVGRKAQHQQAPGPRPGPLLNFRTALHYKGWDLD